MNYSSFSQHLTTNRKGITNVKKTTIKLQATTSIYGNTDSKTVAGYQAYIDTVPVVIHKETGDKYWTISEPRSGLAVRCHAGKSKNEALEQTEQYLTKRLNRSYPTMKALIEHAVSHAGH